MMRRKVTWLRDNFASVDPVLRNSAAVFVADGVLRAFGALSFFLLAGSMVPHELGTFVYAIALVEIFRTVTDGGTSTTAVIRISGGADPARTVATAAAIRVGLAGLSFTALAFAAAVGAFPAHGWLPALACLALFASAVEGALIAPFKAALKMEVALRARIVATGVYVAAIVWGVNSGWSVKAFLAAYVVQEFVGMGILAVLYVRRWDIDWRRSLEGIRPLLKHALPIGVQMVVVMLYFRLDVLFLDLIHGPAAVGDYSVAFRVSESLLLVAGAISASALPHFSRLVSRKRPRSLSRTFLLIYRVSTSAMFIAVMSVSLIAVPATSRLLPQYVDAGPALGILVWSALLILSNVITTDILLAHGRATVVLRVVVGLLSLNVLLNALLIPRYGVAGAALATVLTEAVNVAIQSWALTRYTELAVPLDHWVMMMALGAAAAATLWKGEVWVSVLPVLAAGGWLAGQLRAAVGGPVAPKLPAYGGSRTVTQEPVER